MTIRDLKKKFIEIYGGDESRIRVFSSPGRVNLIGEHTDYNGGYVFPAALTLSSTLVIRAREDRRINLAATDLIDVRVDASLDGLEKYRCLKWGNYQLGVADELQKAGYKLAGCDMLFHDTVPIGSGLSSSAAIEVVTALALTTLGCDYGEKADLIELAKICQTAEHNYIGVKCGIMDQFASAMGKAGHAIFLNCKNLDYKHVPFDIKGCKVVISDSKKKRSLAAVKYNERRSECDKGLEILQSALADKGVDCLGDISRKQFEQHKHLINDEIIRKRVEHIVCEDERVLLSVEALKNGNIEQFGKYMIESHNSLRDLYEVTGLELDTLVDEALKIGGVIGSRMTGAGFGGCTVSIVQDGAVKRFIEQVGENYYRKTGIDPEFYISEIGDGAREIYC